MNSIKHNKFLIKLLSIATFTLFANVSVMAKETSSISSGDLGSGRIKAETAKPNTSSISRTDLGSGRVKAEKSRPKNQSKK